MILRDGVRVEVDMNNLRVGPERAFQHREDVGKHVGPADHHGVGVLHRAAARGSEHVPGKTR